MRLLIALAAAAVAAAVLAAPAPAVQIWSEYTSNTAGVDVTAVDYVGPDAVWYGTADGRIFRNGEQRYLDSAAGRITDIAASPDGSKGLATSTGDEKLYRSTDGGYTWAPVASLSVTRNSPCGGAPAPLTSFPDGELTAVQWASDSVAYAIGANPGMVLKTTDAGNSWAEVDKEPGGACRLDFAAGTSQRLTGLDVLGVGDVWFIGPDNGRRRHTTGDLAPGTSAQLLTAATGCADAPAAIAIDPAAPAHSFAVGGCDGAQSLQASTNGGADYAPLQLLAAGGNNLDSLHDVALAGGSAVAVGEAGDILVAPNVSQAYFQSAPGAATDWFAVDKLDATHAIAAGSGGRMVITSRAHETTDVFPPTGTIVGPATATLGTPTTYSVTATDDRAIDATSFRWTGGGPAPTGVAAAEGNPAEVAFTLTGARTLTVTFRDTEGNIGTATKQVVVAATAADTLIPPGTRSRTPSKTVKVAGVAITLSGPRRCVPPGGAFTAAVMYQRPKNPRSRFVKVVRVAFSIDRGAAHADARAPFKRRLTVRDLGAGTRHTLRARVRVELRGAKRRTTPIATRFSVCSS
jgi:photosystem II stability/assembly factor-like uncharacterized protein